MLKEKGFEPRLKNVESALKSTDFGGHHFVLSQDPVFLYEAEQFASEQEFNGIKGKLAHITCPELTVWQFNFH